MDKTGTEALFRLTSNDCKITNLEEAKEIVFKFKCFLQVF